MPREIKVSDGTGTRRDEERRWNASLAFFPTVPPLPSSVAMSIEANLSTYAHTDARGARSADRDAIVCLVPRAVSTFPLPRVMHKVRERVPWQKIDASLRSFGDKRDALDPLFSPSFPSLPSYPQRDTVEKEEKRNKEKRKKKEKIRTRDRSANGEFSRIIEHARGDKIREHGKQDQGDQDNGMLLEMIESSCDESSRWTEKKFGRARKSIRSERSTIARE